MKVMISRKFEFCYGHRLPLHGGKCKNQHGHNSVVVVSVSAVGGPNPTTGMVMDFADLKDIVGPEIDYLDHKYLNDLTDIDFPSDTPTAENIALFLYNRISAKVPFGVTVEKVSVSETPGNWAEVIG